MAVAEALHRGLWRPADLLPAQGALHSWALEAAEHLGAVLTGWLAFRPLLSRPSLGPAKVQLCHLHKKSIV